jgi:hypothetical protein
MGVCRTTIIVAAALALTGCGAESSNPPPTSGGGLDGPIEYSRSGGIAGVAETMTIQPDGSGETATLQDTRAFQLGEEQLDRLEAAVADADLADVESPERRRGADALEYGIAYGGNAIVWNDLTERPDGVSELYSLLGALYEANAPG